MYAYTGKILHVDLTSQKTWVERVDAEFLKKYVGGVGLATRLVYDNTPKAEIVAHLPLLCDERKAPYVYVPEKQKIGEALGIHVSSSAASIEDAGDAENLVAEIIKKVQELVK